MKLWNNLVIMHKEMPPNSMHRKGGTLELYSYFIIKKQKNKQLFLHIYV